MFLVGYNKIIYQIMHGVNNNNNITKKNPVKYGIVLTLNEREILISV
jgi:hypothetical protein